MAILSNRICNNKTISQSSGYRKTLKTVPIHPVSRYNISAHGG